MFVDQTSQDSPAPCCKNYYLKEWTIQRSARVQDCKPQAPATCTEVSKDRNDRWKKMSVIKIDIGSNQKQGSFLAHRVRAVSFPIIESRRHHRDLVQEMKNLANER